MASKKMKGAALEQAMPSLTADKSTKEDIDPMNDYETQGHMRTILDAHEIMNNPDKMAKVHKLAGRHAKAIRSLQDVKDHYQDTYGAGAKKPSPLAQLAKGGGSSPQDDETAG